MAMSIIICSVNDARFCAIRENYARLLRHQAHEIIRIPDARSLCEGYNRGLRQSKGEIVIFCHDDIEILNDDFEDRLVAHMRQFDVIGVIGATRVVAGQWGAAGSPYVFGQIAQPGTATGSFTVYVFSAPSRAVGGIQILDGLFMAARREVALGVGFDGRTFDGFHCYDSDFSYRAHRAGFRLGVCCDINIFHASRGNQGDEWKRYMVAFQKKFAGQLPPPQAKPCLFLQAEAANRGEVLRLMNPPHWESRDPNEIGSGATRSFV